MMIRLLIILMFAGFSQELYSLQDFNIQEKHFVPRKGQPVGELRQYDFNMADQAPKSGNALRYALGFIVIFSILFLAVFVFFKQQARELELPEDERDLAKKIMDSGGGGMGIAPKESVYGVLEKSDNWLTPGRIALNTGIESIEVDKHLQDLLAEGRIRTGRDSQGRRLYRVIL